MTSEPPLRSMRVNGADLAYMEQGSGVPVVFVHGSVSDMTVWEPQRAAVARRYRFIALSRRYHGAGAWPDDGRNYSPATHVADLTAFLRQLDAGPAHLVGHSYGGRVVVAAALAAPELVRSLVVQEGTLTNLFADWPEARPALAAVERAFAAVRAAIKAGDALGAAGLFFEFVNNLPPGAAGRQDEARRRMIADNARTLPLQFAEPAPAPVTRDQLRGLKIPTLLVTGAATRPHYALGIEALERCIRGASTVVVPQATHTASNQNPAAFNDAVLAFLGAR